MVVFLSPSTASKADDPKLADKESVLASLNLKAMSFDDAVGMLSVQGRLLQDWSLVNCRKWRDEGRRLVVMFQ